MFPDYGRDKHGYIHKAFRVGSNTYYATCFDRAGYPMRLKDNILDVKGYCPECLPDLAFPIKTNIRPQKCETVELRKSTEKNESIFGRGPVVFSDPDLD
jgi:hypothetical protein